MQSDHEFWKENIPKARKLGRVVKVLCLVAISTTSLAIFIVTIVFGSNEQWIGALSGLHVLTRLTIFIVTIVFSSNEEWITVLCLEALPTRILATLIRPTALGSDEDGVTVYCIWWLLWLPPLCLAQTSSFSRYFVKGLYPQRPLLHNELRYPHRHHCAWFKGSVNHGFCLY